MDKKTARKKPRKATQTSLENAALYYLERFATSAENLRDVLMRRVERSVRHHDTDPHEGAAFVDALIVRYLECGLLDDLAFARTQAASMNRRGKSIRAIRARLMQKRVSSADIDDAVEALAQETPSPDLAAAIAYAKKRRLGPWRTREKDEDGREKELAALARSGFSYSIARLIVETEDTADIEAELERS
ncbi:MAG: regulatory protein RecX [Rhodospirillaceae bacterium]|jgi:regulatory protein|nr:regulatory protein RecX [Rhodospirillaceae bacterium]MBT4220600.1 regulatory protein RecX [Rhodospirillaceae bacterium]MBT4464855.1 regulatory protein RecX [Rhodospirillaceae bacterium]MBT5013560.1 regulatory protein RecX [Rhodospirillaceae bacterium]MBT5309097.1 regulatory protein RecX [Rhodospirillaceae bacterium]